MLADKTRQQPRIGIIAAADAVADDKRDASSLVKIGDAIGLRSRGRRRKRRHDDERSHGKAKLVYGMFCRHRYPKIIHIRLTPISSGAPIWSQIQRAQVSRRSSS